MANTLRICALVVYHQRDSETAAGGLRKHPAIVTSVNADGTPNLKVLFHCNDVEDRLSVPTKEGRINSGDHFWSWPEDDVARQTFERLAPDAA